MAQWGKSKTLARPRPGKRHYVGEWGLPAAGRNCLATRDLVKLERIWEDGRLAVKEVQSEKLCLGATCVTEEELKTLLEQGGASSASQTSVDNKTNGTDGANMAIPLFDGASASAVVEIEIEAASSIESVASTTPPQ